MKSLMFTLMVGLLLAAGTRAQAQTRHWDGDTSTLWSNALNWDTLPSAGNNIVITSGTNQPTYNPAAAAGPYGALTIGGSMTLTVNRSGGIGFSSADFSGSCTLAGSQPASLGSASVSSTPVVTMNNSVSATSLTIDADAASAARSFEKAGSAAFAISGNLLVKGRQSSSADDATFYVSAGSANPLSLEAIGSPSFGYAVLEFDQDFQVDPTDAHSAPDSTFSGNVDVTIAASKDAVFKDCLYSASGTLTVVDNTSGAFLADEFLVQDAGDDAAISITKAGAGLVSADSLRIVGGTNGAAFVMSAGGFETY